MVKKKKRGKNRRNFVAASFSGQLSLSTLANNIVLLTSLFGSNFLEDIYIISIDCLWALRGATVGEAPIEVGFSHSDLNVTEVLEALNVELISPDDIVQRERSRRPVRRAGQFPSVNVSNEDVVLNDGKKIRTTIKFSIGNDFNMSVFAVNRTGATLTTGAIVTFNGTLFGRWQR